MPEVLMPRLSDTMETGTLSRWLKNVGDQVRKGDVLAEIETDKAVMEMEAYDEGVLAQILVEEGTSVPIGAPIAVIEAAAVPGKAASARASTDTTPSPPTAAPPPASPTAADAPSPPSPPETDGRPVPPTVSEPSAEPARQPSSPPRASPLARSIARRHGIDLAAVTGSGPGGRIVRADVDDAVRRLASTRTAPGPTEPASAAVPRDRAAPAAAGPRGSTTPADVEEVPLSAVRRVTAQRLTDSAREAPHFYLTVTVEADALLAFRDEANRHTPDDLTISVTDLLVKACATALAAHPEVNCSWAGDRILRHRHVNIGVAVAVDDGLIVPVIRDADRSTLTEIAHRAHALIRKARDGRITPDDYAGGTFTISNLGMYGIQQFTAVINPPQAAILAVGAATRQPVVRGDQVAIGTTMTLTLSIDHRALDGATAAVFLTDLKKLIEQPLRIVM